MEFDSGQFGEWESGLRAINYVASIILFFPRIFALALFSRLYFYDF